MTTSIYRIHKKNKKICSERDEESQETEELKINAIRRQHKAGQSEKLKGEALCEELKQKRSLRRRTTNKKVRNKINKVCRRRVRRSTRIGSPRHPTNDRGKARAGERERGVQKQEKEKGNTEKKENSPTEKCGGRIRRRWVSPLHTRAASATPTAAFSLVPSLYRFFGFLFPYFCCCRLYLQGGYSFSPLSCTH